MKKTLLSIIAVLLCMGVLFATLASATAVNSNELVGFIGDNKFDCKLDKKDGTLTIGGLGALFNGSVDEALFTSDFRSVQHIIFKEGITAIQLNPYYCNEFKNVQDITLPLSLKRIFRSSFSNTKPVKVINYGGTKEDFQKLIIDENNDALDKATVNFGVKAPITDGAASFKPNYTIEKNYSSNIKCTLNWLTGDLTVSGKGILGSSNYTGADNNSLTNIFYLGTTEEPVLIGYTAKNLIIENGITALGGGILDNSDFSSITLPTSIEKISDDCFGYKASTYGTIKNVYYEGNQSQWNAIKMGVNNFPLFNGEIHYNAKTSANQLKYTLLNKDFTFDGESHAPKVVVKDNSGKTLTENVDYYLIYSNANESFDRASVGKYKVFVQLKGNYVGHKTLYYFVRSKAPVISSVGARTDGFTVFWNKLPQNDYTNDGYDVQFSTSGNFANSKEITLTNRQSYAKRVKGLKKGKTYFVRVRAQKKITDYNGKTAYIHSSWSQPVKVVAG